MRGGRRGDRRACVCVCVCAARCPLTPWLVAAHAHTESQCTCCPPPCTTHMHTLTHAHGHVLTCIHARTHTHTHTHGHVLTCIHTWPCTHACMHPPTHTKHTHMHTLCNDVCMRTHVQVLRSLGLNPSLLACRCQEPLEESVRQKLVCCVWWWWWWCVGGGCVCGNGGHTTTSPNLKADRPDNDGPWDASVSRGPSLPGMTSKSLRGAV